MSRKRSSSRSPWLILFTVLGLMMALAVPATAVSSDVTVYTDEATFASTTGATAIPWVSDASTALSIIPWGFDDHSCEWGSLTTPGGEVTVTNPTGAYICYVGPGWNTPDSNTYPKPETKPTIIDNGEDDYQVTVNLAQPALAIGFGLLTNLSATETITLFFTDGTWEAIGDADLATDPNGFEFVGFSSKKLISSVLVDTSGGASQNEGIDSIFLLEAQPPVADVGAPYLGAANVPMVFDGSGSFDADGTIVTYDWNFGDGITATGETATHAFGVEGTYTVTLTVTDNHGLSDTDSTRVQIAVAPWTTEEDCVAAEALFVDATGANTASPGMGTDPVDAGVLEDGHEYRMTAFGTYYAGGSSGLFDIRADAKYTQDRYQRVNGDVWTDILRNYGPPEFPESLLELVLDVDNDDVFDRVPWGAFTTLNNHKYWTLIMGSGTAVQFTFQIDDHYASNNTGGLCVSTEMLNRPPVADPNGPYLETLGVELVFDGTGSSDWEGDALTYDWDFGDGTVGVAVGATPIHAYTAAGIYDVCLTVDDGYGEMDTACTKAVVYDPSAGFVTGGGWIDSPEGAYKADSSLTGKATFGFISKYKKGAAVPTGNTEFQFHAGDLNFHSSSYDWLVVTGTPTAMFKGVGTINGMGEYKFIIWAGDGEPDTFRIKIWEEDGCGGEIDIYDNGSDQPIDAGSIIIHAGKKK